MLKSTARLRRSEFTECFTQGRRHHSAVLTTIVLPRDTFKAAVVVSKKVAKKAHDRNRIKRRLYSLLTTNQSPLGWYIFVVKPSVMSMKRAESRTVLAHEIARVMNPQ